MAVNFRTITAANTILVLSVQQIGTTQIQGFPPDDVFVCEDADVAETQMGVDANMSAGYVPFSTQTTFSLQADSASNTFFEQWIAAQKAIKEILFATNGVAAFPSVGTTYTMTKGVLMRIPQIPSAGKVLRPRKYGITWQSVDPASSL